MRSAAACRGTRSPERTEIRLGAPIALSGSASRARTRAAAPDDRVTVLPRAAAAADVEGDAPGANSALPLALLAATAVGAAGECDGRAGRPPDGAPTCSGPNSRLARLLAAGERTGVVIAGADPAAPGAGLARRLSSAAGAAAEAEPREALSARARACAREELHAAPWLVPSTAQPAPTPSASRQPAASLALTPPPASNQPPPAAPAPAAPAPAAAGLIAPGPNSAPPAPVPCGAALVAPPPLAASMPGPQAAPRASPAPSPVAFAPAPPASSSGSSDGAGGRSAASPRSEAT